MKNIFFFMTRCVYMYVIMLIQNNLIKLQLQSKEKFEINITFVKMHIKLP